MRRNAALLLCAALAMVACSDDGTGPGHVTGEPPADLNVVAPETIVQGQAFELTVTALTSSGTVDANSRGSVALSASAGSLSPATVELTQGTGTVQATLSGHTGKVSITASMGTVNASTPAVAVSAEPAVRLEIVPSTFLLTATGEQRPLAVRAFDVQGRPAAAPPVTWSSSRPDVISISADGTATSASEVGSAQVTAHAGELVSAPALALVAQPADGAILVPDSLVVGEITAADPAAEYGLGWQYRLRLRGISPDPGEILLGTGEKPVGGRVVAVTPSSDEVAVTLEVVPLEEMFRTLVVQESIDLSRAELVVPEEISQQFNLQRLPGGALEFRQLSASAIQTRTGLLGEGLLGISANALDFNLGPFTCKVEATAAPLQLTGAATFTITPDLDFDLDYDSNAGGLQRLALKGDVEAKVKAEPKLETSFESKVDCAAKLAQITLPIGGPIALIFGGQVPLGVGFEINGKTTVANVGFKFALEAVASTEIGIDCSTGACRMINTFDSSGDGSFEPVLPDPTEQFKVELRIFPYGFARLSIGNPFLNALQFETFEVRAGLAQLVDLAPTMVQVENTSYASNFRLSLFGQAKAGSKIDKFLGMLKISLVKIEAKVEVPLAESPKGTFTIAPGSVAPGDTTALGEMATFTVELDPVSYLGIESVEKVEIFWKQEDEADPTKFILAPGRPSCKEITGSSGQTTFECETDFLEEHVGEQTFYAFIHAKLFGLPLPIPLEVAEDGIALVSVIDSCAPPPADYSDPINTGTLKTSGNATETGDVGFEFLDTSPGSLGVSAYARSISGGVTPRQSATVSFNDYFGILPLGDTLFYEPVIVQIRLNYRLEFVGGPVTEAEAEVRLGSPGDNRPIFTISETGVIEGSEVVEFPMHTWAPDVGWTPIRASVRAVAKAYGDDDPTREVTAKSEISFELIGVFDANGEPFPVRAFCTASGWNWGSP